MYFARTLLLPVLLISALVDVASAQHKYIFPQFPFGGGWESTLMVQASDTPTTCTFSSTRPLTMRDPSGNVLSGTPIPLAFGMRSGSSITLTFGMNGWTILKTAIPQDSEVSSGMAVLDCSEEVSANTLFSLEVGGSLVAEAVVESAEEIVAGGFGGQFLADHRDGARFGMAVANPSTYQGIDVSVRVAGLDGQQIANTTVNVPPNTAQAFFVDEIVTIPTGHTGQVLITPTASVYAVGLRFSGQVFTTVPATVFQPEPAAEGLNTRLTDPNGQWTVVATAKITEGTYLWTFDFVVDITNRTYGEGNYSVDVLFVDADGFLVGGERLYGDVPGTRGGVGVNTTKRLYGRMSIVAERAATVAGILLEVERR